MQSARISYQKIGHKQKTIQRVIHSPLSYKNNHTSFSSSIHHHHHHHLHRALVATVSEAPIGGDWMPHRAFIFLLSDRSIAIMSVPDFKNCFCLNVFGSTGFDKIRLAHSCIRFASADNLNFWDPKILSISNTCLSCLPKYRFCSFQ